jgi:hypothetical protein
MNIILLLLLSIIMVFLIILSCVSPERDCMGISSDNLGPNLLTDHIGKVIGKKKISSNKMLQQ